MLNITPLIRNIIFTCVAVYIVHSLMPGLYLMQRMSLWKIGTDLFRPYQLFTYMFAHGGIGHLFFNMLTLVFIGSYLEMVWGFKRFLTFYLASGIGAAVIYVLIEYWLNPASQGSMLGASGAIYGILVAYGILFSERELHLMFPPISIKGKYLVFVLGFMAYILDPSGQVAHLAHFGGALTGYILLKTMRF